MKPLLTVGITLALMLSSCHVEKRVYMRGYHISWKKSSHTPLKNDIAIRNSNKTVNETKPEKIEDPKTQIINSLPVERETFMASTDLTKPISFKINSRSTIFSIPETGQECDQIIMKNGDELKVKVLEITSDLIKYKFCDDTDGPLRSVKKSEVFMIKYPDGTKEVISSNNSSPSNSSPSNNSSSYSNPNTPLKTHPLGIVGFITSILGLFIAGVPLGILSIIFGGIALKKIKNEPQRFKGKGLAVAAVVIGIIALVLALIVISMM